MASEIDRPVVERLDVNNYSTWKTRMKFLLITKGLWSAIAATDGEEIDPSRGCANVSMLGRGGSNLACHDSIRHLEDTNGECRSGGSVEI